MDKIIEKITYDDKTGCFLFKISNSNQAQDFLLSYETYIKLNLHVDDLVDGDTYELISAEDKKNRALIYAEKYALYAQRSEGQVIKKLKLKAFDDQLICEIIEILKQKGLLNDAEFALRYSRDRSRLKKWSKRKISSKLYELGLRPVDIENALAKLDDEVESNSLRDILYKKYGARDLTDRKEFDRTYQAMVRRGFNPGHVLKEMNSKLEEDKMEQSDL